MKNRLFPYLPILLLFCWMTSGSGCAVLQIPSYRDDKCGPVGVATLDAAGIEDMSGLGEAHSSDCTAGFLPPIPVWQNAGVPKPGWWAEWCEKKDLPKPAPFPRFQPLPTRPMFSPRAL